MKQSTALAVPSYTDVTKIWQDDPTRLPLPDLVTVLYSRIPVIKQYVVSPINWKSKDLPQYPKRFKYKIFRCSTASEMGALLKDLKEDHKAAIVPGLPADDWEAGTVGFRRKESIFTRDTNWIILDFDLLCPKQWHADTPIIDTFKMIWKEMSKVKGIPSMMPECVWELSSGWGNPAADYPKLHLYLKLDQPVSLNQLGQWCKHVIKKYKLKLDPVSFRQNQLIYTAAPSYIGDARYVNDLNKLKRVYVHKGTPILAGDLVMGTPAAEESIPRKPRPGDSEIFELVLNKLDEAGLLLTKQPRGGTHYDVICPVHEEHSTNTGNATSTSIMAPDDRHGPSFWCQHSNSHPEGRNGWTWYLNQLVEQGVLTKSDVRDLRQTAAKAEFTADEDTEDEHRSNWICQQLQDNYIYVSSQNRFYDRSTNQLIGPDTFRTMHPQVWLTNQDRINGVKPVSAPKSFMRADMHVSGGTIAVDEAWQPSKTGLLLRKHGQTYLNNWKDFPIIPKEGDPSAFFKHIAVLCPDEEQQHILIDFLAHMFQHPEERPKWAIIHVVATQGIGRGLLHELISRLLDAYAQTVSLKQMLKQDWNEYLYKTLWAGVEETSTAKARSMSDQLKDLVTLVRTNINPKGGAILPNVDVYTRLFFMTNHLNALPIDPTDRRFWVCGPEDQYMKPQSGAYYIHLAAQIENPRFLAAVMHALLNRDLSKFHHGQVPSKTELTHRMVEASRSVVEEALLFIRQDEKMPPFATSVQLLSWIQEYVHEAREHWSGKLERDAKSLIKSLRPMGGRGTNGKVKTYMIDGGRYRFYILKSSQKWSNPPSTIVRKVYHKHKELS